MSYPVVSTGEGVTRQVLSEQAELMVVAFRFDQGGVGALHNHIHVQATYVQSGRFRFSLGGVEREVVAGDSFVIPSMQSHGCICLEAGVLIDSFTPRRDDFL
jgi:quercetin dioxygenase-like cupin family protein